MVSGQGRKKASGAQTSSASATQSDQRGAKRPSGKQSSTSISRQRPPWANSSRTQPRSSARKKPSEAKKAADSIRKASESRAATLSCRRRAWSRMAVTTSSAGGSRSTARLTASAVEWIAGSRNQAPPKGAITAAASEISQTRVKSQRPRPVIAGNCAGSLILSPPATAAQSSCVTGAV